MEVGIGSGVCNNSPSECIGVENGSQFKAGLILDRETILSLNDNNSVFRV